MRDVLIDDRDPLVVDRDDERVAELAERDHRSDLRGSTGFRRFAGFRGVQFYKVRRVQVRGVRVQRLHEIAPRAHGFMGPAVADGRAREHAGDRHRLRLRRARRERRELELGGPALAERVAERAPQHFVHERLLEEPDLRLRRVHVHVHRGRAESR